MKQKVISTMLLLSMGATLLAGCGTTAGNGTEGGASKIAELLIKGTNMGIIEEEELLEIAAVAESMSNHPIAKSIISKVNKKISQEEIEEYKEIAGMGIKAKYHGDEIVVGNAKLLEKEEIKYYPCNEIGAIVYVAKNKKYLGAIVISDTVKPDSKEAIEGFKKNGINKICMLTGDNKEIAENIAKQVGIEEVH